MSEFRCGYVAIVGRPNVGKSTLMNYLIGQKVSITSPKPQTTRHRIIGIKSETDYQIVFVDTPGIHQGGRKAINRYMNRAATGTLEGVDLVLFLVVAGQWGSEDQAVADRLREFEGPILLVVNKVDQVKEKARLLPFLQQVSGQLNAQEVVPVSALKGDNLKRLEQLIVARLPLSEPIYPEDQITDRSERFLAAEVIREKLMRRLSQELPYALTVEIELFKEEGGLARIAAVVWVERETQKGIVIGKGGEGLREVGRQAREELERMFERKVFLELWVKVREGWSDDERALGSLGYTDE